MAVTEKEKIIFLKSITCNSKQGLNKKQDKNFKWSLGDY